MQKENLTTTLKELGFSSAELKDLLIYTLNTKDRQEQMLSWILANKDTCNKEVVQQKAREILRSFLSSNPYNNAAKNMPPPKWEPPRVPPPKPAVTPPADADNNAQCAPEEDSFYALMEIFAAKR